MKISEVINSLESYLKEKGDLNVYKWSEEGELEAPSIIDIYNDFFNNYNVMFRKQETMFKLEEYIELLKEYDNNTFSELVKIEEERKTVKKTKTKFPIHYPKYKNTKLLLT